MRNPVDASGLEITQAEIVELLQDVETEDGALHQGQRYRATPDEGGYVVLEHGGMTASVPSKVVRVVTTGSGLDSVRV